MNLEYARWIVSEIEKEIKNEEFIIATALVHYAYKKLHNEEISIDIAKERLNNWKETKRDLFKIQ